ncbi:MAG: alpha/beta hydrolase [Candidatus Hydrogenedentota bacterium]
MTNIIFLSTCVIIIINFLLYYFSGSLLYRATRKVATDPSVKGWFYEETFLQVGDRKTLCWYIPAEHETRRTILFSHGNAGNIGDRLKSISIFREMEFNVLAYDYGGYGNSTGTTTEKRCYADIRAVWRYARDVLDIPATEIILFGRSLGAGPTVQLATEESAGAVVIESAFRSVPKIIREHNRWLPGWVFGRNRFDNESKMADILSPVIVVHGELDTLIPYDHGRCLFELAPEPKVFLDIHGEHHEGFWKSGADYTHGLMAFFNKHLGAE